jgi:hypothetical protein
MGFDSVDYGGRLRVFLDGYGLEDRSTFVQALQIAQQRRVENLRYWSRLRAEDSARFLGWIASNLRWLAAREPELQSALG